MKNATLRLQLGLTQQEMSMLLGMSRSHYSMYELGKTQLPLSAFERHSQLLLLAKRLKKPARKKQKDAVAQAEAKKHFERLQRENDFQYQKTARRIAVLQKLQQADAARLALLEFLETEPQKAAAPNLKIELRKPHAQKTSKRAKELLELEIRLQVLEFEKSLFKMSK